MFLLNIIQLNKVLHKKVYLLPPITQIQDNSHILGVFSSPQRKIEEGLEYLRIGFEYKNEAILMVTDELTKDEIKNEIIKKWNISPDGLGKLEKNGIVNIKSSSKLYFSTSKMDREEILKQYSDITNKAIKKGKRGLRAFVDMRIFFERTYVNYVIEFEKSLPISYDFPLTFICAYDLDDFKKLDQKSRKILFDHHNLYLTNNAFRSIFDISDNTSAILIEHICMFYEDNRLQNSSSLSIPIITDSILRYIDEGLLQNQLCVYLSIYNMKKEYEKNIISQISNKDSSIYNNFMLVPDTDRYYINAVCENLTPFEDLKKLIFAKAILGNKKNIRIVCDIPDFLFKNKHFDQSVALEEWWNETLEDLNKRHGLNVSLLCLYHSNNSQKRPYQFHRHRINDNHTIICDVNGIIQSKYYDYDSLIEKREKNDVTKMKGKKGDVVE